MPLWEFLKFYNVDGLKNGLPARLDYVQAGVSFLDFSIPI